jgi:signal transduction histidine kinase
MEKQELVSQHDKAVPNDGTRFLRSMYIMVILNLAFVAGLFVTILFYRTGSSGWQWLARFLAILAFLTACSSVVLYKLTCRNRRVLHTIEAYLRDFSANQDARVPVENMMPFPVGSHVCEAARGWNRLVEVFDKVQADKQQAEAESNIGKFSRSYDAQRLIGVIESLPDGIILADDSGNIVLANRSCEGMLARPLSEFMYQPVGQLFDDEQARRGLAEVMDNKFLRSGVQFEVKLCPANRGAAKHPRESTSKKAEDSQQNDYTALLVCCHRLTEAGGSNSLLMIIRDITQQKISQAGQEDFIAHVSHELRSPLTNIRAYAETLLSDMVLDAGAQKEAFNVINEETGRLIRLINDVLDVSRMETGTITLNRGEVEMARLIQQGVNDIKASAGSKKITVQTNYHPKLPNLYVDREKIAVVINNIFSNAIKYTPEGGTVFIETNLDDRYLYIKVADTGYGIAAEDIDKIFDKFYRVRRPETSDIEGTGMGLTTSKLIVLLHGGTIKVSSELNSGTELVVKLPLTVTGPILGTAVKNNQGT